MNIRGLVLFLYIIISFFPVCADQAEGISTADSIYMLPDDTNKVNLLIGLSMEHAFSEPLSAIAHAEQAVKLADSLGFTKGLAIALKYKGIGYYVQSDFFRAINFWLESLEAFKAIGDLDGESNMLSNIGSIYFNQGQDLKALEYYLASLKAAESTGNKLRILTALTNVGNVYSNKEQTHDLALEYYHRALKPAIELDNLQALATISVNMGQLFVEREEFDSARYYYEQSLEAFRNIDGGNTPYTLNYLGEMYAKNKEPEKALPYQQEAYEIASSRNAKLEMAHSLLGMAKTYSLLGNTDAALKALNEAETISEEIEATYQLKDAYEGLSEVLARKNDYRQAYGYRLKFDALKDSIYNTEMDKKLERLMFVYDLEKKQTEINLLVKDNELQALQMERQRLMKNAFMGGLILILIIAFILVRSIRLKIRTNKLLGAQKKQIENLLLNILPEKVARELQMFGFATPRHYDSASVLFTDFKGFSSIAKDLSPNDLVSELNEFFVGFDAIVEKYGLEKIKTIGDAYMCAGGIPTENDTHPYDIVAAGLEMQQFMENKNRDRAQQGKEAWGLRVGVHTGPLVAGVVGKKKYAYDIWGSSVNISSRMESNGEAGKLNISATTYELVKNKYKCSHRGKIYAKNIGDIDMYFVEEEIRN